MWQSIKDWFKGVFTKGAAPVVAAIPTPVVVPTEPVVAPAVVVKNKGPKMQYAGPFLDVKNVTIDDSKYLAKHAAGAFNTVVTGDQAAKNVLINFAGQGGDRPASPGDTQPGVVSGNFDEAGYNNPAVEAVVVAYKAFKQSLRRQPKQ